MAKWDLSKLPEGRKPLPDEWFREKAQMQGRIEELEAKLAKAVEALVHIAGKHDYADDPWGVAITTLAELKGEK